MIISEENGCYRITISETVDGKRIRKTKRLPAGVTLETAYAIAETMMRGPMSFADRLARIVNCRPDAHGYVYFIKNEALPGLIKIGMTRGRVHERIRNLSTAHTGKWWIVASALVKHAEIVEAALHRELAEDREAMNREFFRIYEHRALELAEICASVDGVDLRAVINAIGRRNTVIQSP